MSNGSTPQRKLRQNRKTAAADEIVGTQRKFEATSSSSAPRYVTGVSTLADKQWWLSPLVCSPRMCFRVTAEQVAETQSVAMSTAPAGLMCQLPDSRLVSGLRVVLPCQRVLVAVSF